MKKTNIVKLFDWFTRYSRNGYIFMIQHVASSLNVFIFLKVCIMNLFAFSMHLFYSDPNNFSSWSRPWNDTFHLHSQGSNLCIHFDNISFKSALWNLPYKTNWGPAVTSDRRRRRGRLLSERLTNIGGPWSLQQDSRCRFLKWLQLISLGCAWHLNIRQGSNAIRIDDYTANNEESKQFCSSLLTRKSWRAW